MYYSNNNLKHSYLASYNFGVYQQEEKNYDCLILRKNRGNFDKNISKNNSDAKRKMNTDVLDQTIVQSNLLLDSTVVHVVSQSIQGKFLTT